MSYKYDYTSYGAGGGAGGGGFIPGDGSQSSPGGRKEQLQDTIRPVTIKQVLDAEVIGDEILIDGTSVSQVTLVGQIRNIARAATNVTYKLEDGTGAIEIKQWVDTDIVEAFEGLKTDLHEDTFCRAWGKVKSYYDKKYIGAQIIRRCYDLNEVNYHLLEATYVHLYHTRGPLGTTTGQLGAAANEGQGQRQPQGANVIYGADLSRFTPAARRMFKYLYETPQSNEGLHLNAIAMELNLHPGEVAQAGDALLEGGLIYTTVDDQTWAILEAD